MGFHRVPFKGSIRATTRVYGIGALIIRIGFWGILYYENNIEYWKLGPFGWYSRLRILAQR